MKQSIILYIAAGVMISGTISCAETSLNIPVLLQGLKPLPKVHYSFPIPDEYLKNKNRVELYELARIMHSACVSGEWSTEAQVDACVFVCGRVNKATPSIPSMIGINYSPWHRVFGKTLPPTDRGKSYTGEIEKFRTRLQTIRGWVEKSNRKYSSAVQVGAVLLDSERFFEKAGDVAWNEGMREALDAIHQEAVKIYPKAAIEWYSRGMRYASGGTGWEKTPLFTGKEIMPSLSCSLYFVPEIDRTMELYRQTAKLGDAMKVENVTPWVALASGYRRGLTTSFYWDTDWDYDLIYSYQLGTMMNVDWYGRHPERFAPFTRAKIIVFYPPPFDSRTPGWGKHFVAYVRGATEVKELSDLGYVEK